MRYGIISDVHSNLEGLTAALEALGGLGVDSVLCCGDIIGYGAEPGECLERLRGQGVRSIRGNHERGLRDLDEGREPEMNWMALEALRHNAARLDEEQKGWLLAMPDHLEVDGDFLIFHGSPSDPDIYVLDDFEAHYAFKSLRTGYSEPSNHLCFIGHTHVCSLYILRREDQKLMGGTVVKPGRVDLVAGMDVMINVGSCGQYRGGRTQASFCLYDRDERWVEFFFVDYDVRAAQEKIRREGLPEELAERLSEGW
jgi:diadenosine tetraphosphatase ApaH/serine/threonine PP2A family protein phosphatase